MKKAVMFLSVIALCVLMAACSNDIELTEENFPDEEFLDFLSINYDDDDNGKLSEEEINAITEMELSECYRLKNIKGIELFTSLETLTVPYTSVETLNLTGCKTLKKLVCKEDDDLLEINVSGCEALEELICELDDDDKSGSHLQLINASGCKSLRIINAANNNEMTSLNIEGCGALSELVVKGTAIQSLALSENTSLTILDCNHCKQLSSLTLPQGGFLKKVDCSYCDLSEINITDCKYLTELNCNENHLAALDLKGCANLEKLACGYNSLSTIDVKQLHHLKSLSCNQNNLTRLDLTNCATLEEVSCSNNQITDLALKGCTSLKELRCGWNQLTMVDISGCPNINCLYIHNNFIDSDAVDALIRMLPNRGSIAESMWTNHISAVNYSLSYSAEQDNNHFWSREQVDAARAKGWRIFDEHGYTSVGSMEMYYWMR